MVIDAVLPVGVSVDDFLAALVPIRNRCPALAVVGETVAGGKTYLRTENQAEIRTGNAKARMKMHLS